jgi:hypothetical protein
MTDHMQVHLVTGRELLAILGEFSPEHYPHDTSESESGALCFDGSPILENDVFEVWSCSGSRDLVRFDSDWRIERKEL